MAQDDKKELRKIIDGFTAEYKATTQNGKFDNQIMWNGFVHDKLAEFELRLRKIEKQLNNP